MGTVLGAQASMVLGVFAAALAGANFRGHEVATIISGLRSRLEITARQRMLFVLLIVAASSTLALLGQYSFLNSFKYFINKERYDIPALSDPAGRYGRWNVLGISVYVSGVLIQLPFVDTHFYSGPMVAQLGGVDISWIVGLVVPGVLYYLLARKSALMVPVARSTKA